MIVLIIGAQSDDTPHGGRTNSNGQLIAANSNFTHIIHITVYYILCIEIFISLLIILLFHQTTNYTSNMITFGCVITLLCDIRFIIRY